MVDFVHLTTMSDTTSDIFKTIARLKKMSIKMESISDWEKSLMLVVFKKAADKMPQDSVEKELFDIWLKQYSSIPMTEESMYLLSI